MTSRTFLIPVMAAIILMACFVSVILESTVVL